MSEEVHVVHRHRLAFGIEPRDALRDARITSPLLALREAPFEPGVEEELRRVRRTVPERLHAVRRTESCRFVLLDSEVSHHAARPWVDLLLVEGRGAGAPRRYVPRRIRIPFGDPAFPDAEAIEVRVRRPALFPGADYDIHESATALRGRVVEGLVAVRWARIEALLPVGGACPASTESNVIAVAHGDERGEFLLVLPPAAAPAGRSVTTSVCVRVWAPPRPVDAAGRASIDPYWDLPLETLSHTPEGERIAAGVLKPATYTRSTVRNVTLRLGRTTSGQPPFIIA